MGETQNGQIKETNMPLELIATAARTPQLREYEERPLQPNEARVKSLLSAPKHGTELRAYRADTMDDSAPFDGKHASP